MKSPTVAAAEARALLQRFLNELDGDYWAEADEMTKTTPYECVVPVGLIWDIAAFLEEQE